MKKKRKKVKAQNLHIKSELSNKDYVPLFIDKLTFAFMIGLKDPAYCQFCPIYTSSAVVIVGTVVKHSYTKP